MKIDIAHILNNLDYNSSLDVFVMDAEKKSFIVERVQFLQETNNSLSKILFTISERLQKQDKAQEISVFTKDFHDILDKIKELKSSMNT